MVVYLGAEFYPPAAPEPEPEQEIISEYDLKQPETNQTPALMEKPKVKRVRAKRAGAATTKRPRKAAAGDGNAAPRQRRPRSKKAAPPPGPMA